MAVNISLEGVNITGDSKFLTNTTIKSSDVDIKVKDTTLSNGAAVLDSALLEEKPSVQNQQCEPRNDKTGTHKVAKGIGAFVRDVLVNCVSDLLKGKP